MAKVKQGFKPESVLARTGKPLSHWFKVLDKFDVKKKGHKEAAKMLREKHGVSAWWSQMLTVQYEQERGLRKPLQRHDRRFAITVSRTVKASLERVWACWADADMLSQWFTTQHEHDFVVGGHYRNVDRDSGVYLRIVPLKRIRFTWEQKQHQPGSEVEVSFARKGKDRVLIALDHGKLQTKKDALDLKHGWSWAMDCLKMFLETGRKIGFEEWKASKTSGKR